jgi:hypothetical protein
MGRFVIVEEDVVAGTVVVVSVVQNISKSGRFVDGGDVGLLAVVVEDNVIGSAVVVLENVSLAKYMVDC